MQELKPVAWMRTGAEKSDGPFGHYGPVKIYSDDAALYAIPDTHRVVPIWLLERVINVSAWNEHEAIKELRAIIEDKP